MNNHSKSHLSADGVLLGVLIGLLTTLLTFTLTVETLETIFKTNTKWVFFISVIVFPVAFGWFLGNRFKKWASRFEQSLFLQRELRVVLLFSVLILVYVCATRLWKLFVVVT